MRTLITNNNTSRRDFLKTAALGAAGLTLISNGSHYANALVTNETTHMVSTGHSILFVGTFKREPSKGIYAWRLDETTGNLDSLGLVADVMRPVFLAIHPNGKFLYAASRPTVTDRQNVGVALAYSIDEKTSGLTLLNSLPTGGIDPAYLAVDRKGRNLLVANYGSTVGDGCVSVFPIKPEGNLAEVSDLLKYSGSSVHPQRQTGPHSHAINVSPDNRFVFVADLGLDKIFIYHFDADKAKLTPADQRFVSLHPGAGPRQFAFHPNGRFLYVVNELQSTLSVFKWSGAALNELQTISTLPKGLAGTNSAATLQVHPKGKFLYASNRGADSIASFSIDAKLGTLTPVDFIPSRGKTPGSFSIDPSGAWLIVANQSSDSLVVFRIDVKTGSLIASQQSREVGTPSCVRFLPIK